FVFSKAYLKAKFLELDNMDKAEEVKFSLLSLLQQYIVGGQLAGAQQNLESDMHLLIHNFDTKLEYSKRMDEHLLAIAEVLYHIIVGDVNLWLMIMYVRAQIIVDYVQLKYVTTIHNSEVGKNLLRVVGGPLETIL
ncbi:hypothetical protein ACJX0J_028554, partial [Zea mays]